MGYLDSVKKFLKNIEIVWRIADIQIKRKLRVSSVATHALHKEHKQDVKVSRLILLCDDTIEYSSKIPKKLLFGAR